MDPSAYCVSSGFYSYLWNRSTDGWKRLGFIDKLRTRKKEGRQALYRRMLPVKEGKVVGICAKNVPLDRVSVLAVGRVVKGRLRTTTLEVIHVVDHDRYKIGDVVTERNFYVAKASFEMMIRLSNFIS
jgi:hypothetical protein